MKEILISINAVDKATPKIKNTEKAVTNLGSKVKTSSLAQAKSFNDVSDTLDALGNRFRYLSLVAGMAAGAMIMTLRNFVDAAVEAEAATVRLGAYAQISGQAFDQANEIALKFARTGLMSITEASNTLSNLLATGMNLDTAEKLMTGMLNTAVLSKEILQDTFGKALEKSSLGVRILQERQVDAIGINFRSDQVWRAYGKTIGKTTDQMSTQEKQMAVVNFLLKETAKFSGGAAVAASTFGGTLSKLNSNVFQTKAALGNTLTPVIGPLVELLTKASNKLREFASQYPALTMVVLAGTSAVTVFVAALAMLGALIPMVTGKMMISVTAMKAMSTAAMLTGLKFMALAIAVGTLIYLIAKATGQWDKWSNSIKNLQKRIADTIKPAAELNEELTDPKVAKQLKKIQDQMNLTTRSFKENMREWVDKHDKTIRELKSQINDLEQEYTKAMGKITSSFEDTQDDNALAHRRKVEDIQREIDEEVSKGIWADQTKIRNLERELARENEDYNLAQQQNEERRDEDLQDSENKYSKRLDALREELAEAEALEKKHSEEIAKYRTWPLLDYIEKQERQHTERLAQLQEQMSEVTANAEAEIGAHGDVNTSIGNLIGAEEERRKHSIWSVESHVLAWQNARENIIFAAGEIEKGLVTSWSNIKWGIGEVVKLLRETNWHGIGQSIRQWLVGAFEWFISILAEADKQFREFVSWVEAKVKKVQAPSVPAVIGAAETVSGAVGDIGAGIGDFIQGLLGISWPGYAKGGIVPGPIGQATPAIVHGGETIIPANQSPITVNINNPSVRNDNDIRLIAKQVQEVLGRQQFLKQYK